MLKLHNMIEFSTEVERLVHEEELTYLEAVMHHLQLCGLDVDSFKYKSFLSPKIVQKLEEEAYDLKLIGRNKKPPRKLPI